MSNRSFDIIKENIEHLSNTIDLFTKSVILFGVNTSSFKMLNYLREKGVIPKAIIDNNLRFSGKTYLGIPTNTPKTVLGSYDKDAIILIVSRFFEEMKEQLLKMGYTEQQIYQMDNKVDNIKPNSIEEVIEEHKLGFEIYKNIQKEFGEDKKIIMCPYAGLGDVYFISAYIVSYCEIHNIDNFVLTVIGNTNMKIAYMFGIENIKIITQQQSNLLKNFATFMGAKRIGVEILSHRLISFDNIMYNFEQAGLLDWGTIFRYGVLEISKNTKPRYITIDKESKVVNLLEEIKKKLHCGKTAIISPYANTIIGMEDGFWEEIVIKLKEKNYEVYTNSIGDNEPIIAGSQPLAFPIEIAKEVVEYAGVFIGVRSGLCDVIEAVQAKVFVLYPDKRSLFYNLKSMGFGKDVTECIYNEIWNEENWLELMKKEV